jgi:D-alanyl-D-alanine endopeptidase (penicillin-binding protein 7)
MSFKGLPVTRARLFRIVRPVCLITVVLACGLSATTATAGEPSTAITAKEARLRKAEVAKVRAEAMPPAAQSGAQEARFKLDETGALVPDIRAAAAIIYNPETGQVLWESHSQDQRSIASLTKMMTALVLLEESPDLSESVVIQRADVRNASTTYLRAGDRVTKQDLLHLMLIASDNAAARAVARSSPLGSAGFIARMNEKAKELGLTSTKYADPSGLLAANLSSAYDIARLIAYVSSDDRITAIMQKQTYSATASRRKIDIHSTNRLVREGDIDVQAGKTGFIRKAGYCLATLLRLPQGGPQVAIVVLGASTSATRFGEAQNLFNWMATKASDLLGGTTLEAAAVTN